MNNEQVPATLSPGPPAELRRIGAILRTESVGGFLLIVAAVAALVAANGFSEWYFVVRDTKIGGTLLGLDLRMSIGHWASDGLLAVFFFLVGLELKREFVTGELRDVRTALVPVAAAVGGVLVPALIYLGATFNDPAAQVGWAIPVATDIAFALAVLAVINSHLPGALRTFLLTLAVADDLIAITIIAVFYSQNLAPAYLLGALMFVALFWLLAQRGHAFLASHRIAALLVLFPIGALAWAMVYASGVHATIAGVLLALGVPVRTPEGSPQHSDSLAELLEHRVRPFSAGIAVPVFAFLSAGVAIGGWAGFTAAVASPVGLGVVLGLIAGKAIGITGGTWLITRLRRATLDPTLAWIDVLGVAVLGGIGFTVSLLVSELSFGQGSAEEDVAKVSVLTASVLAAVLAAIVLGARNRHYRRLDLTNP